MPTPINLNKARKARSKADKERQAEENRIRFGRSKAQREADKLRKDQASRSLDGRKLDE